MTLAFGILLVIISTILGAFGTYHFKKVSDTISFNPKKLFFNYKFIFASLLFGLSAGVYIIALTKGQLNVLYPISSLGYLWTTIISKRFLNEKLNGYKIIGITFIIIGAIFVTL